MTKKFIIHGYLDGLNEYTNANRTNRYGGARIKRINQDRCGLAIREYLKTWRTEKPVDVKVVWYEANRKRDPDNVFFGIKFILDALVERGTIPNDSQKYVRSIAHFLCVDREDPRVEVEITEVENGKR